MAYTNVWDATRPAGTVPAGTIDNEIRALRLDIQERFNDALFVDFEADPLVLKDTVGGPADKQITMSALSMFVDTGNLVDIGENGKYVAVSSPIYAPIYLPVDAQVTEIEMYADRQAASGQTWTVYYKLFGSGVSTIQLATVNHSAAGLIVSTTGVIDFTIGPDAYYFIHLPAPSSTTHVYAFRFSYTTPNVKATI